KLDSELSRTDYLLFYTLRSLGYAYRQKHIPNIVELWNAQKRWLNELENERAELCRKYNIERSRLFMLSILLYKKGIIKYLGFDKPENVEKLTEEYKKGVFKEKGIDLTIQFIIEKYKKELKRI
ncbi:MAG: hypothetical protein ACP5RI_04015, partial [Candidatus Micrarchaeia archaeon]